MQELLYEELLRVRHERHGLLGIPAPPRATGCGC